MNETVRAMVEQLFENTVMNEETQALRDEVMNNCQERWEDLKRRGLPEQEILAAVSDSLKGMEDIVAAYPKKEEPAQPEVSGEDKAEEPLPQPGENRFPAEAVTRLVARLTDGDIDILPSEDPDIRLELTHTPDTILTAELDGEILRIDQRRNPGGAMGDGASGSFGRSVRGTLDTVAGTINDAIRQLTQLVQRFTASAPGEPGNKVRVFLPAGCRLNADIQSLSGSIAWNGADALNLLLDTTSGDLDAVVPAADCLRVAQFKSASGDIRADVDAENVTLQSMSGDIHWSGVAQKLNASSISGDLEIEGRMTEASLKSVSGDVNVKADESAVQISAVSTSGDITVNLPAAVSAVQATLRTVSGGTHINNLMMSDGAPLHIKAQSVSGDISLTRHRM